MIQRLDVFFFSFLRELMVIIKGSKKVQKHLCNFLSISYISDLLSNTTLASPKEHLYSPHTLLGLRNPLRVLFNLYSPSALFRGLCIPVVSEDTSSCLSEREAFCVLLCEMPLMDLVKLYRKIPFK